MAQPFFCHHLCLSSQPSTAAALAYLRPEEHEHLRSPRSQHLADAAWLPGSLALWHSSSDLYHLITTYAPSETALACGLFPLWFKHA